MRRLAVLALVSALCLTVFAATPISAKTVVGGGVNVTFNGHPVLSDVPAQIISGRTMLPFRAIFEALGATVSYDPDTQTVSGVRGSTTVQMQIGNMTATVNNSPLSMDVAPVIVNSRTLVPVRFVAQSLPGVTVDWDPNTQTAKVGDPNYPHRGGAYSIAIWSAPDNVMTPLVGSSFYDQQIVSMLFDGLFLFDNHLSPIPALASSWEVSDDNLTYTFHLRPGTTWHDGAPFTADDVKFTYEAIMNPAYLGPLNSGYDALVGYDAYHNGKASEVTGIKVIDANTVSFTLQTVNASFFIANLGTGIVPKHLLNNVKISDWGTSNDPYAQHPIGTGAYMWSSAALNQYYILERNPNYFLGAPYLDRVIWKVLPQDESIAYLGSGEVDMAEIQDFNSLPTLQGYSNVKVSIYPNVTYQGVWFNNRPNNLFSDKSLRQAVAYSIDRMAIINGLLKGNGTPMYTTIHPLQWAYSDDEAHYDLNPDKARALLDADGWVLGSDGVRVKNGQRLHISIRYPTGNKVRMAYAPMIKKWLQDVGFEVELKKTDFTTLLNAFQQTFDFDIVLVGQILGNPDPDQLPAWSKDQVGPGQGNNAGWVNDTSEQLLKAAVATNDQEQRKAKYVEWQKLYGEEMPSYMIYANNEVYATSSRMHNFKPAPLVSGHIWNCWEWWVDA